MRVEIAGTKSFSGKLIAKIVKLVSAFVLFLTFPAYAQQVWIFSSTETGSVIILDTGLLAEKQMGQSLAIRVSETDVFQYTLDRVFQFENGDKFWHAKLAGGQTNYSLVLTTGSQNAYASVTTPVGRFQLDAKLSDNSLYSGWLSQVINSSVNGTEKDYVLPGEEISEIMGESFALNLEDISSENFTISQTSAVSILKIGDRTQINLQFKNISAEQEQEIYVDIYFILETTALVAADSRCIEIETDAGQNILSCFLGDLAPGEEKSLSYEIEATPSSHPTIFSTAIVGEARHDFFLEVYRDVITDSDEDGVSDFNEELLGTDPLDGFSVLDETTIIDVMALVTREAAELYENDPTTRINHLISVANSIFTDSGVKIQFRPVLIEETAYTASGDWNTDLSEITYKTDPAFNNLDKLRLISGADLVVLFTPMSPESDLCGLSHLGGLGAEGDFSAVYRKDFSYSVIALDCPDDVTLAHETGHVMGLVHSRREEVKGGTFSYSAGYGVDGEFVTVMASGLEFNTDNRVFLFSNPELLCGVFICGIDASDAIEGANAAYSLNQVRHQIASYFTSLEERLTDLNAFSPSNLETSAVIIGGATGDMGITYTEQFAAETAISVLGIITPEAEHVGMLATLHVVVKFGDSGFFQLDRNGKYVKWDGKLSSLLATSIEAPLLETEKIQVLTDYVALDNGMAGQRMAVYVAYQVFGTPTTDTELIYNLTPLSFQFDEELVDNIFAIESFTIGIDPIN